MLKFSNRLKELRKLKKITQKQLAIDLCISERNYQDYEYTKVIPSAIILIKLADYFDVSIDYLVGRSDNPARY